MDEQLPQQNPIPEDALQPSPTDPLPTTDSHPRIVPKWALALFFILLLVVFCAGMYVVMNNYKKPTIRYPNRSAQTSPTVITQVAPTIEPIKLTNYTNDKYQFTLQYPEKGRDMNGNDITCGRHFVISPSASGNGIIDQYVMDSFFTITVVQTNQSLTDYLASKEKEVQRDAPSIRYDELYDIIPLQNSGADEAVMIRPKATADRTVTDADNVGLGATGALYKKVNTLYVLGGIQDYVGPDMCVPPLGSKSWRPSEFAEWDVPQSIHFD